MQFQSPSRQTKTSIHDLLEQFWGYQSFRPLQEDIIRSILDGRDSLAIMPTGGGKSLCYQVPGLALQGLCLVISPLIALMKDQVEHLRKKNITAFAIYSGMSRKDVINTLKIATQSNCKFLYVSPERLETSLFREYLPALDINLIAVDEAHCISQWGYDFRPPYLRIAALRAELPGVPVLALTASATKEVQEDICEKLLFSTRNIFAQSLVRPELSYSVFKVPSRINKIIEILKGVPGSAIIYCRSRRRTKEIAELISMQQIPADYYHAGLLQEERNKKQEAWIQNKLRVIVCTNAFGMGIDKPDVRVVVHADTPDCLENYYQEAGRAGRDRKKAYAVLLYADKDLNELENSIGIRFPSIEVIRQIYQSVSNYLQVPAGSGVDQYFDFDLGDFVKKFKLNSQVVFYALKALEQDGWLEFNEQVFIPSTVRFTTSKEYLRQFELDHPGFAEMIKTLLRAYEGIFDFPAAISEKNLSYLLKKDKPEIKQELEQLHRFGIIEFLPQKDKPQLLFLRNRIKVEDLVIDQFAFDQRKEKFTARIGSMMWYMQNNAQCRSKMIADYFGDKNTADCGVCDNCLNKRSIVLTGEEFKLINDRIIGSLKRRSMPAKELLHELHDVQKEKAWSVIGFLQDEQIIVADRSGRLQLK